MRYATIFLLFALCVGAQTIPTAPTNRMEAVSNAPPATLTNQINAGLSEAKRVEQIRAACVQNRRRISGKILKILPEGMVVDSGYTNLTRAGLDRNWLVPRTATATRATNVVEENQPGSMCIGLVFLTDAPKTEKEKPKVYDYVNLEGFPAGQYTYASVGDLHRTVRKFSTKLAIAVRWQLEESDRQESQTK